MNDSNSHYSRKNRVASVISLTVGLSALVLLIVFFRIDQFFTTWIGSKGFPYALLIVGVSLIAGIISGKKGLDSSISGIAQAGVVICTICFIIWCLFTGFLILSLCWQ